MNRRLSFGPEKPRTVCDDDLEQFGMTLQSWRPHLTATSTLAGGMDKEQPVSSHANHGRFSGRSAPGAPLGGKAQTLGFGQRRPSGIVGH